MAPEATTMEFSPLASTLIIATPVATLVRMREIALAEGLHYVYVGNVPGQEGEHTRCPGCGRYVVRRLGHSLIDQALKVEDGRAACAECGTPILGRF